MFKNKTFREMLRYYIIIDIVVFVIINFPYDNGIESNIIFRLFIIVFTLLSYIFIWDLKGKYKEWDKIVNLPIYFLVLFLVPAIIRYILISLGIDEETLHLYRIDAFLFLLAKFTLYYRTNKLAIKYGFN